MALDQAAAKKVLAGIDRNELAQLGSDLTSIPSPTGQEKAAQRFATVVCDHAREAGRTKADRDDKARRAENELDHIMRDRTTIEAAETELARVEADPGLLGAIDDARERLNRARADTPELIEARRKVLELARRMVAPPEALRAAMPLS